MAVYDITACSGGSSIPIEFGVATPTIGKVYYIYFTGLTTPACYSIDGTSVLTPTDGISTISNAMDVGNPSNFVRMQILAGGKWEAIKNLVKGYFTDDQMTKEIIK